MDQENFTAFQETRTSQEDTSVQNMDPEEEYAHRLQHAALERTILHHLSIQQQQRTREHHTQQEAFLVAAMDEAKRSRYNYQKVTNQLNHRNSRGPDILDDDDILQYILSFDRPNKLPLEDLPFVQQNQQKEFRDGTEK